MNCVCWRCIYSVIHFRSPIRRYFVLTVYYGLYYVLVIVGLFNGPTGIVLFQSSSYGLYGMFCVNSFSSINCELNSKTPFFRSSNNLLSNSDPLSQYTMVGNARSHLTIFTKPSITFLARLSLIGSTFM